MKVTIVGAGNMGRGIGTRVVAGGHELEIVDRDPADAGALAAELGGSTSALDPGALFGGEVIVLAVYYPGIKDAVGQYADQVAGKVVVDITNPVDTNTWGPSGDGARQLVRRRGGGPRAGRDVGRKGVQHQLLPHSGRR